MYRTAITRQARLFSTSTRYYKTPIEVGKDALKKVDRTVSDTLVKGIETGETVVDKTKATVGADTAEMKGNAKGKASELMGEAKGKTEELKGQAKGTAEEVKGKM